MKEVRYHIDPETGQPHIYEHNVDESEVEEVLAFPIKEGPGREGAREIIGKTFGGRFLKVFVRLDKDGMGIFVITAYDLRGKALATIRRYLRRKS
jgi:hypothetical protein